LGSITTTLSPLCCADPDLAVGRGRRSLGLVAVAICFTSAPLSTSITLTVPDLMLAVYTRFLSGDSASMCEVLASVFTTRVTLPARRVDFEHGAARLAVTSTVLRRRGTRCRAGARAARDR
jgi:hypothetical protein